MTENAWFVKSPRGEMVYGPYSLRQMEESLQLGKLSNDYHVSHDRETWRCIGDILTISATKKLSIEDAFLDATIAGESKEKFENYQLLDELGRGGMGIVYKALDKRVDRIVALKVLLSKGDERQLLRFIREGQVTAQLRHPNIVSLYEVGEHPKPYFTMDYIQGRPLNDIIRENALTVRQIVAMFCKICAGLEHAHRNKVIHRDIKPANILIDLQGEPKITDFGIAKTLETKQDISYTGEILGTPKYMSPEQANGKRVDARSDIYSLGAVFYELLVGRPPFDGNTVLNILSQLANNDPIPPRDLNPEIPLELETICLTCLQKSPARRYLTAKLLRRDLERFLENRPVSVHPPSPWERSVKWMKRNKAVTAFGGLLLLWGLLFTQMWHESELKLKLEQSKVKLEQSQRKEEKTRLENRNLKIAKIGVKYQEGCAFFQQKSFGKAYESFNSSIIGLNNLNRPLPEMVNTLWMRGCIYFIQKKYHLARRDLRDALLGCKNKDEKAKLQILSALCAAEENDIPAARGFLKQAKENFYRNPANRRLEEFLPRLKAIPGELASIPFHLPFDRKKLTDRGARYYLIAHLLPKHMKIDAQPQLFVNKQIPLNCLVAREIITLDYLLSKSRVPWIEAMLSQLSFSEVKAIVVNLQGQWVLDMVSPYWTHLPLSAQQSYSSKYQQAYARQLGTGQVKEFVVGKAVFSMALIPPGQFIMGKPYAQNEEGPATLACVPKHFWMAQTEVTQRQWNEVLKHTKWKDMWTKYLKKYSLLGLRSPSNPAFCLSWEGIQQFFIRMEKQKTKKAFFTSGRFDLPTERQWEYCCKSGGTGTWYWTEYPLKDNEAVNNSFLWYQGNSTIEKKPVPHNVKRKLPNAWKLYDICGNIGEVCKEMFFMYKFGKLPMHPSISKIFPTRYTNFIYRGGNYRVSVLHCSSTTRRTIYVRKLANSSVIGFRFVFILQ